MKLVTCVVVLIAVFPFISGDIVTFSYVTWVGDKMTHSNSKSVHVPRGSSVYEGMLIASKNDPTFTVEIENTEEGHYITAIGGIREVVNKSQFWMFYDLKDHPDNTSPPSDKQLAKSGIDKMVIKDGHYYLLWFKTAK